ncbi:MAG: helix-turn-helix domain-containing protein [Caldisericia bacterium]
MVELSELLNNESNKVRLLNAGFSRPHLWMLQNGLRKPTINTLIKIGHTLRISRPLQEEHDSTPWTKYPNSLFFYLQVKKINVEHLEKLTGIKYSTLKRIYTGAILPSRKTVNNLCRTLWLKQKELFPHYESHRRAEGRE